MQTLRKPRITGKQLFFAKNYHLTLPLTSDLGIPKYLYIKSRKTSYHFSTSNRSIIFQIFADTFEHHIA